MQFTLDKDSILKPTAQVCKAQLLFALAPGPTQCQARRRGSINTHEWMVGGLERQAANRRLTFLLILLPTLSPLRAFSDQVQITGNDKRGFIIPEM